MYSHLAFSIDSSSGSFTKPAKHSTRLVIGSKASMSFEWSFGSTPGGRMVYVDDGLLGAVRP